MPSLPLFPLRTECPPGLCDCERARLLEQEGADIRILRLTRSEEQRLIARIETIASYADLMRVTQLMQAQLGMALTIAPSAQEVRTVRGLSVRLEMRPGLCRQLRKSIPAAVRRCLEGNPQIMYEILDRHDLLGQGRLHGGA